MQMEHCTRRAHKNISFFSIINRQEIQDAEMINYCNLWKLVLYIGPRFMAR